jgi:hypothetical protein
MIGPLDFVAAARFGSTAGAAAGEAVCPAGCGDFEQPRRNAAAEPAARVRPNCLRLSVDLSPGSLGDEAQVAQPVEAHPPQGSAAGLIVSSLFIAHAPLVGWLSDREKAGSLEHDLSFW